MAERLRAWVAEMPAGERVVRVALAACVLVTLGVAVGEAVASHSKPDTRVSYSSFAEAKLPYLVLCPDDTAAAFNVSQQVGAGPDVEVPVEAVLKAAGTVCYVYESSRPVRSNAAYQGSYGLSVYANSSLSVLVYVRSTRPERISFVEVEGDSGVTLMLLEPPDEGQAGVNVPSLGLPGTNLTSTWALALRRTDEFAVSGAVEVHRFEVSPLQALVPRDGTRPPALFVYYSTLGVQELRKYVRLGVLFVIGAVGGAVTVTKILLQLYLQLNPRGGTAGTAAQPLLEAHSL